MVSYKNQIKNATIVFELSCIWEEVRNAGLAKIVGSSVGGFLAEQVGIGQVFRMNGFMLIAAALLLYIPLMKRRRAA